MWPGESLKHLVLTPEVAFGMYLRWKARAWRVARGQPLAPWENAVLQSRDEWQAAVLQVRQLALPPHPDPPKNWDTLAAVYAILREIKRDDMILDAGADFYSRVLPWLWLYGYRRLVGINLAFESPRRRGPIRYLPGDVRRTEFPADTFAAITCLSTIEHGVDPGAYFKEMARILKPGGLLITSTDYYEVPVETTGLCAYGAPIRIFSAMDVESLIDSAGKCGLALTGPLPLGCREPAVYWKRFNLRYTFIIFTLRKAD